MSISCDDPAMASVMYRPGLHREQIDRYKAETTADRTSFTRFRALKSCESWNAVGPITEARRRIGPVASCGRFWAANRIGSSLATA